MLAQNLKTAADLGIPEWECSALVTLLGMLEREEIRHGLSMYPSELQTGMCFNMTTTGTRRDCGTVACIGGWARILAGRKDITAGNLERHAEKHAGLFALYFPPLNDYSSITTEQAAIALRSYLTTGAATWPEDVA